MRIRAARTYAPAASLRSFEDSFSGALVADPTRAVDGVETGWSPNYWTTNAPDTATAIESGGALNLTCPGDTALNQVEIRGQNDHGLNFFAAPVKISFEGLEWDIGGAGALPFEHRLSLTVSSTRENHFTTPSAVKFWLQENRLISLSAKAGNASSNPENANELVDNADAGAAGGNLSGSLSSAPTSGYLILDRTSYELFVTDGTSDVYRSGEHGLNPTDWGTSFYLGLEGLYNSVATSASDATFRVGSLKHENLLALDLFQNSNVESSGWQFRQYVTDDSGTDTATECADGLILTADGSGAGREVFVTSRVDSRHNPFTNDQTAHGRLSFSGAAAGKVFKFYLASERKTPSAAQDCILLTMAESGAWAIYEKINAAGADPESLTARDSGTIGSAPTDFSLNTTKDQYTLTVNGTEVSTGNHQFRTAGNGIVTGDEYRFGASGATLESGDAAYGFAAERPGTSETAVCTVKGFRIERDADDAHYVAQRNNGPVGDGMTLRPPHMARSQTKVRFGVVDVTKAPFYADNTGVLDSTNALNLALHFGRDHSLVCFFPAGTYEISGPLAVTQQRRIRTNDNFEAITRGGSIRVQGSYAGTRPKIRLAASSPGFGDDSGSDTRLPVLEIYAQKAFNMGHFNANDGMECIVSNIDIEVLAGNPGAIGVRAQGAQGTELRDMTIDLTASGAICVDGGPGSGGGIFNVWCKGGRIGLEYHQSRRPRYALNGKDAAGAQPLPIVRGCRFTEQTEYPIKGFVPGVMAIVGCEITVAAANPNRTGVFGFYGTGSFTATRGQVIAVDTRIDFEVYHANNKAFDLGSSIFLSEVYTNKAATVVAWRSGTVAAGGGSPAALAGNNGLTHVTEFGAGVRPVAFSGQFGTKQFQRPTFIDGVRSFLQVSDTTTVGVTIPPTLRTARIFDFPHFEMAAENVLDHGAVGDAVTDDTAAIQAALDAAGANGAVFVPKGYYVITDTLDIPANCKMFGLHRSYSYLVVRAAGSNFSSDASPKPILRTVNSASATPYITDLGLLAPSHYDGAYCLHQRAGQAVVWGVQFEDRSDYGYGTPPGKPGFDRRGVALVYYSDNGGGVLGHADNGGHWEHTAETRHLLFEGLTNDLDINMLNVEHAKSDAQTEFSNCSGKTEIFGIKTEGPYCAVWFSNGSENFRLYGFTGNFTGVPPADWNESDWRGDAGSPGIDWNNGLNPAPSDIDYSLSPTPIRIDADCDNYRLVCIGQSGEKGPGYSNVFVRGFDPADWNMIWDDAKTESPADLTPPLDYPVVYKRGTLPA